MIKDKFVLKNRDEVRGFSNLLKEYSINKTKYSISHISLVDAYERLKTEDDGGKIFTALLDIEINFVLLYCDIHCIGSTWNRIFSKGKLEGGSVLDSKEKYFGKMDIHRHSNSFILRYRALWDKIMGFLILFYAPADYEVFCRSDSRKKSFKTIAGKIKQFSPDFIKEVQDSLETFDSEFRTPEAHGTGRLRKWSFLMAPIGDNPLIYLFWYWNFINEVIIEIGNLFKE